MKLLPRLCMASGSGAAGGDSDKLGAAVSSSSSSTGSSSSSSSAAAAVSEASSSTSLPSLPSLSATTPNAASFAHLTTLLPPPAAPSSSAVVAADSSHGSFVVARPASVALHVLSTLEPTSTSDSTVDGTATAGSVKCVAHVQGGGGGGYAAVTGHQDGRLRLWRLSTRAPGRIRLAAALPTVSDRVRRFPVPSNHVPVRRHHRRLWIEHSDAVSGVAASADGRLLFSVSWDKTLKVWAVPSLHCLQSLPAHDDAVNAVAAAPQGGLVYTGSADRRVRVWAPRPTDKAAAARSHSKKKKNPVYYLVATLTRHTAAVNAVAVGSGGQVLYSGGNDRSVVVWEKLEDSASHMVAIGVLRGHRKAVLSVACAGEDGMVVVSGSADRTVRAWRREPDSRAHACVAVFDGHGSAVRSVAAARVPAEQKQRRRKGGDGEEQEEEEWRVCSASFDGEVRVWSLRVTTGLCL